jgi:hypothetical protein
MSTLDADVSTRGLAGGDVPPAESSAPSRELADWERANADYLTAGLAWLRLLLSRAIEANGMAASGPTAPPATPASPAARTTASHPTKRSWRRRSGRSDHQADGRTDELTVGATRPESDVARARAQVDHARDAEPAPALRVLADRLGMSRFEEHVLLLCAAMELDPQLGGWCARASGDPARPFPSFALAMTIFDDAAWSAMSPERPLRLWRLIEINQLGGEPLTSSALRADERIVSFLKGLNHLDDRLNPLLVPLDTPGDPVALPPSQRQLAEQLAKALDATAPGTSVPIVQLVGSDGRSRQLIAREAAERMGLHLVRLPAEQIPHTPSDLVGLARLWERESTLLPIAMYLDADVGDRTSGEQPERDTRSAIRAFLERSHGVFFVGTPEVMPQLGTTGITIDVRTPLPIEQRRAWESGPLALAADDAKLLAGQFNLDVATIEAVARSAGGGGDDATRLDRAWHACLGATRPRLDLLAQRVDARATWADIVLPDDAAELLRTIEAQVRARSHVYDEWGFRARMNRGLGISALFAGESGTGKTMAAEVLANRLGLNLYRIDLSAVVSKYIGETEKNLRQLFDAAEGGGAILFFDEADALFGKRSEVKDSHDRYANIEVNYLLQRMEAYEGLAILATNLRSALDRAFLRRLRFIVTFPVPGVAERTEIWRRVFPAETPLDGIDHDRLGRLALTGGGIHNVALNAAFAAAGQEIPITMPLVLDAARAEFRKMDKPINEADFRWKEGEHVA